MLLCHKWEVLFQKMTEKSDEFLSFMKNLLRGNYSGA